MKKKLEIELEFSGRDVTSRAVLKNVLAAIVNQADTAGITHDEDEDFTKSVTVRLMEDTGGEIRQLHHDFCG
jgi:hypothetical protein